MSYPHTVPADFPQDADIDEELLCEMEQEMEWAEDQRQQYMERSFTYER
jgi:hypothetical protein